MLLRDLSGFQLPSFSNIQQHLPFAPGHHMDSTVSMCWLLARPLVCGTKLMLVHISRLHAVARSSLCMYVVCVCTFACVFVCVCVFVRACVHVLSVCVCV